MDIRELTALELGEKISKREISSVEATKAYLDAIKAEGQAVNAYITVMEEEALHQAGLFFAVKEGLQNRGR